MSLKTDPDEQATFSPAACSASTAKTAYGGCSYPQPLQAYTLALFGSI